MLSGMTAPLSSSTFSDIVLVIDWPRWEYSYHGNWQTLQIRVVFQVGSARLRVEGDTVSQWQN